MEAVTAEQVHERLDQRFQPACGQWIDCDEGWWPLILDLDERLASIDPAYALSQVKEKYGGLRYSASMSDDSHPVSIEGISEINPDRDAIKDIHKRFYDLIDKTEELSYSICERCGKPGSMHVRGEWMKTLCADCAAKDGYSIFRG